MKCYSLSFGCSLMGIVSETIYSIIDLCVLWVNLECLFFAKYRLPCTKSHLRNCSPSRTKSLICSKVLKAVGLRLVEPLWFSWEFVMKGAPPHHSTGKSPWIENEMFLDSPCENGSGLKHWLLRHHCASCPIIAVSIQAKSDVCSQPY